MSPRASIPLTIEFSLLGILKDRPMHGYEIYQLLSIPSGLGLIWRVKQGQLYALLEKLSRSDYLSSTLQPQTNRPDRVVFSITPEGLNVFAVWIQTPVHHPRSLRQEFLAKYYFSREFGGAKELLSKQHEICAVWSAQWIARINAAAKEDEFGAVIFRYRLEQVQAVDRWIAAELAHLEMEV